MRCDQYEEFFNQADDFITEIVNICKENSEVDRYEMEIVSLELLIMQELKKMCKVYVTGLYDVGVLVDEIVDFHIVIDDKYFEKFDNEKYVGLISALELSMMDNNDWTVLRTFKNTPKMDCLCHLTNRKFRISIGNGFKVAQYKILRYLFDIQPEALPFYHFIRHWLKEKNRCTLFTKYILLLVVFYLQDMEFFPPLFDVFLNVDDVTIDGWQIQFDETRDLQSYKLKRMEYYRKYVLGFFDFYRHFDFKYWLLNVHRGRKVVFDKYWRDFRYTSAMNIVFVDREQNFSKYAKNIHVNDFKHACKSSIMLFKDF